MGWELGRVGDFIKSKGGIHRMVFKKQGVGWRLGKIGLVFKKSDGRLGIMLDGWFVKHSTFFQTQWSITRHLTNITSKPLLH